MSHVPRAMQAVRHAKTGGPEVLGVEEVPVPEPGPGEALVRLHAASVNHLDVWLRSGSLPGPLPHIPGCDGAGEVAALGPGAGGWAEGDRCLIAPALSCGRCGPCVAGEQHLCGGFDVFGTGRDGTYAPYVTVPARNLLPVPENLEYAGAATLGVAAGTAWHLLVTRGRLRPGETVLVHGAGSGLGVFAIQIARLFRCRVFTTCSGEKKARKARDLGADAAIDHRAENVVDRVRGLTGGRGVDVVFDHVGAGTFPTNLACLATGGRLLVCGTTTGGEVSFNLRDLFARQQTIHGARLGRPADLFQVIGHAAHGRIVPIVDATFPLAEAGAAHGRMERREHFGKIVLDIP